MVLGLGFSLELRVEGFGFRGFRVSETTLGSRDCNSYLLWATRNPSEQFPKVCKSQSTRADARLPTCIEMSGSSVELIPRLQC